MPPGQVPTEAPGTTPGSTSPAQPNSLTGSKEELALAKEAPEVQDEYKTGLRAFQAQQFDNAIQQFRSFQRKYPNSEMADDAQYWIGESYFDQRDYNRAILEFNDVLKYRKGDRVPAALLRQAQAFLEIGDKTDARLILQKLLNDHPNSEQAQEAKARLQVLGR
jgi:tol-pal system protein YbgF